MHGFNECIECDSGTTVLKYNASRDDELFIDGFYLEKAKFYFILRYEIQENMRAAGYNESIAVFLAALMPIS